MLFRDWSSWLRTLALQDLHQNVFEHKVTSSLRQKWVRTWEGQWGMLLSWAWQNVTYDFSCHRASEAYIAITHVHCWRIPTRLVAKLDTKGWSSFMAMKRFTSSLFLLPRIENKSELIPPSSDFTNGMTNRERVTYRSYGEWVSHLCITMHYLWQSALLITAVLVVENSQSFTSLEHTLYLNWYHMQPYIL